MIFRLRRWLYWTWNSWSRIFFCSSTWRSSFFWSLATIFLFTRFTSSCRTSSFWVARSSFVSSFTSFCTFCSARRCSVFIRTCWSYTCITIGFRICTRFIRSVFFDYSFFIITEGRGRRFITKARKLTVYNTFI